MPVLIDQHRLTPLSAPAALDTVSTARVPRRQRLLDRIGMSASLLCAIHCAAMPLAITLLPLLGAHILFDGTVELVMIAISATVGVASLGSSYRVHRRLNPLLMMTAGATILIANFFGHETHSALTETLHPYVAAAAGLMIAFAHRINMKFCSSCERCEIDSQDHAGHSHGNHKH